MKNIDEMKAELLKNELAIKRVPISLMEVFGLSEPVQGFPNAIAIKHERHALTPCINFEYTFDEGLLGATLRAYASSEAVMLVGEKGTGKSSFVEQFCARMNQPLLQLTVSAGTEIADLLGCKTIAPDGSVFAADGVISYAYRHGLTVLLDEFSSLREEVALALNPYIQGDNTVTLNHHGFDPSTSPESLLASSTLVKHPGFRIFAADNTGGKIVHDKRYGGTNEQNSAVRSRFTVLEVGYMEPLKEFAMLQRAAKGKVDDLMLKLVLQFGLEFRSGFSKGYTDDTLSFRELKRWVKNLAVMSSSDKTNASGALDKSFVESVYGGLQSSDQQFAENLWKKVVGKDLMKQGSVPLSAEKALEIFNTQLA